MSILRLNLRACDNRPRRGYSLVELIVSIAIVAVLIAIVLSAVGKLRSSAALTVSRDRNRSLAIALNNYASGTNGKSPGYLDEMVYTEKADVGLLAPLYPYLDGEVSFSVEDNYLRHNQYLLRPSLTSAADPSVPLIRIIATFNPDATFSITCTSANSNAFTGKPSYANDFQDGTSQTIAYVERYAVYHYTEGARGCRYFDPRVIQPRLPFFVDGHHRRATFADRSFLDVYPVTSGVPAKTVASVPGKTFEVRPPLTKVDATIPQTPFAQGLVCAMFDGSTRVLNPSIREEAYWALVTRSAGDSAGE
jgi:prepilin-type N-terminal cleavage/methylation domain-containing protein